MTWNPPETAPKDGTPILGDFGWPWPCYAIYDPYDGQWSLATHQACPMQDGPDNHYIETEWDAHDSLRRWMPLPSLSESNQERNTESRAGVAAAAPCSALAGARYRSSYVDGGKKTWTPWKTVGDHWGIARNHFSELSECWTKDTEWDFSGSHDLAWNELRGHECFQCGIPLPSPLGQEQPPTAGNSHRGRLISEPNTQDRAREA